MLAGLPNAMYYEGPRSLCTLRKSRSTDYGNQPRFHKHLLKAHADFNRTICSRTRRDMAVTAFEVSQSAQLARIQQQEAMMIEASELSTQSIWTAVWFKLIPLKSVNAAAILQSRRDYSAHTMKQLNKIHGHAQAHQKITYLLRTGP